MFSLPLRPGESCFVAWWHHSQSLLADEVKGGLSGAYGAAKPLSFCTLRQSPLGADRKTTKLAAKP